MLSERWGTAALILTPKVMDRFGAACHPAKWACVDNLYQDAARKSFQRVIRARSVSDFAARIKKSIPIYAKQYDDILYQLIAILGPSRFEIEYIKQVTKISKELSILPFGALDLSELFRRHFVCCNNTAASYEELLEAGTVKLEKVGLLLRTTNYGLTLMVLLLEGALQGPVWMMGELEHLTSRALREMEAMPEIRTKPSDLEGSMVMLDSNLDLTSQPGKPG